VDGWGSANLLGREWTSGARVDGWGSSVSGDERFSKFAP